MNKCKRQKIMKHGRKKSLSLCLPLFYLERAWAALVNKFKLSILFNFL